MRRDSVEIPTKQSPHRICRCQGVTSVITEATPDQWGDCFAFPSPCSGTGSQRHVVLYMSLRGVDETFFGRRNPDEAIPC